MKLTENNFVITDKLIEQIREVVKTRLPVCKKPPITKVFREEYLSNKLRKEFYKTRDNIKDFDVKFKSLLDIIPFELPALTFYDKLKIYKLFDPEYEVWSAVLWIPGKSGHMSTEKSPTVTVYGHFRYSISTSGKIHTHINRNLVNSKMSPCPNINGYLSVGLDYQPRRVHRIVLSTFGSDIDYKGLNKNTLTVNHKTPDLNNNDLFNLEWMTHMENIMDMSLNDRCEHSSQPIKGTILIDLGLPIGTEFYLRRRSDIRTCGLTLKTFGTRILINPVHFGIKWEDVTKEEISDKSLGIPPEVTNWIKFRRESNGTPVEITVLENIENYKAGTVFYLRDRIKLKNYSGSKYLIGSALIDGLIYKKCRWKYLPKAINYKYDENETLLFLDKALGGKRVWGN